MVKGLAEDDSTVQGHGLGSLILHFFMVLFRWAFRNQDTISVYDVAMVDFT